MTKPTCHARILAFPNAEALMNARLAALYDEQHGRRCDLVVDYDELQLSRPVELVTCDGRPCERIQGHYVPRRLRFVEVSFIQRTGFYTYLDDVSIHDARRRLRGVLYWRPAGGEPLCVFDDNSDEPSTLPVSARHVRCVSRHVAAAASQNEQSRVSVGYWLVVVVQGGLLVWATRGA